MDVTVGPVTLIVEDNPDTSLLPWDNVAVFDLTNNGSELVTAPYRVDVASADGQTTGASDGTAAIVIPAGQTVTVVEDAIEPFGPVPPETANVTLYDRAGSAGSYWAGPPDFVSSNEMIECFVSGECPVTADLTYNGQGPAMVGDISFVVRTGDQIVVAGIGYADVQEINPGETIPYNVYATTAPSLVGSEYTSVEVTVEQEVLPGE
jgi:hypothetical protein